MSRLSQGRSVVTDFAVMAAVTLLAVGLLMYAVSYMVFSRAIERQLRQDAEMLSASLSAALEDHIWNMDGDSVREYMEHYPAQPDLVRLRVASEFGDLIYGLPDRGDADVLSQVHRVYRDGKHIGTIELSLSRRGVRVVRRAIAYSSILIIGTGVLLVLGVMVLGQGMVVGRGFRRTLHGIQKIADGEYSFRLRRTVHREFDELNALINRMAEQIGAHTTHLREEIGQREAAERELMRLADSLESEVDSRTQELVKANLQLQQEIMERRKVEAEILTISSREQQRLGRDLHDSLGQQLVGIAFLGKSLASKLKDLSPDNADLAAQISTLLQESVIQTRQIAHGMYPVGMLESGIKEALQELGSNVEGLFGVRCTVVCDDNLSMDLDAATHLYRIAQEAVNNARRHGGARNIDIALLHKEKALQLTIRNDGAEFGGSEYSEDGIGMRVMRYRAEAINGIFSITNADDESGVMVRVVFPCS
jgi:signal transduction histidine kinase